MLGIVAALALVAVTTVVTRAVAGERAARIAAVLSAGLASSIALAAVYTPVGAAGRGPGRRIDRLPRGRASPRAGPLAGGRRAARGRRGADQAVVPRRGLRRRGLPDREQRARAPAAAPLGRGVRGRRADPGWRPSASGCAVAHVSPGSLVYALFGFRIHALNVLAASNVPLHVRLKSLWLPRRRSGLFALLVIALRGLATLRGDRVLAVTLAAWLGAGAVGVLGGGSYWPHYLIELVAPASLLSRRGAVARPRGRPRRRPGSSRSRWSGRSAASARCARGHAAPRRRRRSGATCATTRGPATRSTSCTRGRTSATTPGLPSPYPYAWSLLVRAHPGATARLRQLLESPRRPTWIVGWQRPSRWGLDPGGATARALHAHYRVVAHVHGHPIYHRTSSPRSQP